MKRRIPWLRKTQEQRLTSQKFRTHLQSKKANDPDLKKTGTIASIVTVQLHWASKRASKRGGRVQTTNLSVVFEESALVFSVESIDFCFPKPNLRRGSLSGGFPVLTWTSVSLSLGECFIEEATYYLIPSREPSPLHHATCVKIVLHYSNHSIFWVIVTALFR